MKMKPLFGAALFGALFSLGLSSLQAGVVHFSPPQSIGTPDPMLDQAGTLVGAAQWSNLSATYAVATTSGTISFAPGGTGGAGGVVAYVNPTSTNGNSGFTGTTGNAALNSALAGFAYTTAGSPVGITLKGLTVGQLYTAQVFSSHSGSTAQAYLADKSGNTSAIFSEGSNSYVLATFVADATTQLIQVSPSGTSSSVSVNAVVLRHTFLAPLTGNTVQFSLARPIKTPDPMLDRPGTLVGAAQWSNLGSTYVVATSGGTVSFAPGGTGGAGGIVACVDQTSTNPTSGFTGTTGNTALNSALAGFAYTTTGNPLVLTLKGLTVGQSYSVQVFSARSGSASRAFLIDPAGNISTTFSEGANNHFLATFIANAATQQLRLCPATGSDSVSLNAVVLRKTTAPQSTSWRGFDIQLASAFTLADMTVAKATFHANLIRYHLPIAESAGVDLDTSFHNLIQSADFAAGLDAARTLGLAVVFCLPPTGTMHIDSSISTDQNMVNFWDCPSHLTTLTKDWTDLATACQSRTSQEIWFDLLNEPEDPRDPYPHEWPVWAQTVINGIRAVDPVHKIVIEPGPVLAQWTDTFPLLDDDNLTYSFHTYNPTTYTNQAPGASGLDWPGTYPLVPPSAGNAVWNIGQLEAYVAPAALFSARNPFIPIFVGEFSVARNAPHAAYYLEDSMMVFEQYGWDWDYHSFREAPVWNLELANSTADPTLPTDRANIVSDYMKRNYEILSVDFNSTAADDSVSPTQPDYAAFNVSDGGALHGPVTQAYSDLDPDYTNGGTVSVTLASGSSPSGTGILLGRDRGTLPVSNGGYTYGSLFANGPLYQDLVIAQGTGTTLWITISGLKPSSAYRVVFYAYDNNVTTSATATFTNQTGGAVTPSGTVTFNGSYPFTSKTSNTVFSTTLDVTSDASGKAVFKETVSGGSASQAELSGIQILHQ